MNWHKHKVKSNLSKHSVLSYYTILFHAENRDVVANQIREFFLQLSLTMRTNNFCPSTVRWRFISYYTVLVYAENME